MAEYLILLVEDNPDDVALTLRALRKTNVQARVIVARDGVEALDYFFANVRNGGKPQKLPDIIILDLKLPKIDGVEVLERLRAHERTRFLPIIVLTTSNEERDIAQCYRLGANSYIRKPVEFTKFSMIMRQIGEYWLQLNEPIPKGIVV